VDSVVQNVVNNNHVDGEQFNNNGSVQLVNKAQQNAAGVAAVNSAQSASNLGLNMIGNLLGAQSMTITQVNNQTAHNDVY